MEVKFIAIVCAVLFLGFLIYKEWNRPVKTFLILRLICTAISVGSFLFLLLPIRYEITEEVKKGELTLINPLTAPDSIPAKKALYTLDSGVLKTYATSKIKFIPDLSYYLASHPEISQLNLYGEGFADADLEVIKGYQLNYHPSVLPTGIQSCNWDQKVSYSQPLKVQGLYHNNSYDFVKLRLKGLGTTLDSFIVRPQSDLKFDFKTTPKQMGQAVYQLLAMKDRDTLEKEDIPFEVKESEKAKILLLASSPDFEYKFLKNWLTEHQYPVALRTRISKDKFSTAFLNIEKLNLQRITQSLVQQFDLVIADDLELTTLNGSERAVLSSQIEQGMGLLVRMNDVKLNSSFAQRFILNSIAIRKNSELRFQILGNSKKLNQISIEDPIALVKRAGDQQIVSDESTKVFVNSKLYGAGQLLLSTIPSTYSWFLNGNQEDYSTFWSAVINNAIQADENSSAIQIFPQFPEVNYPVNIQLTNKLDKTKPVIEIEGVNLPPLQSQIHQNDWEVTFWPKHQGWNELKINNQITDFYVYGNDSWKTFRTTEKIKNTTTFSKADEKLALNSENIIEKSEKELSKWWFFFLFMLSAGFLWFESRRI